MADIKTEIWKKWIKADNLERIKIVEELPIAKTYAKMHYPTFDMESALDMVATMLNSYFEDLLESILENPDLLKNN